MTRRCSTRGALVRCAIGLTLAATLCCALSGCGRKPAPRTAPEIVVQVAKDGTVTAGGEKRTREHLLAFLKEEGDKTGRDEEGLPVVGVVIAADPECPYKHVQDVMVQCMRAYITSVSWEMEGRRVDADLPRHEDHDLIEPEVTLEEAEELVKTAQMTPEETAEFLRTVREEERARGRDREPKRRAPRGELRVRIYWVNDRGQVVHSPERPFPAEWPGVRVPLSTKGAHVVISINRTPCADLDEFVRRLRKLVFGTDHPPVVIDPRRGVPFRWVFDVVEACGAAGAGKLRYQSPPVEGQGGSDWWWM